MNEVAAPYSPHNTLLPGVEVLTSNGKTYESTVPGGFDAIYQEANGRLHFHPSALDGISPGKYEINEQQVTGKRGEFDEIPTPQKLELIETEEGKYISADSIGAENFLKEIPTDTAGLMTALGYIIDKPDGSPQSRIIGLPTPDTFKAAAQKLGVNVELLSNQGKISPKEYLEIFARGAYPVASDDEVYYVHDISDDHITAVVLGGDPIKAALADISVQAIAEGEEKMSYITGGIDGWTATLRAVIAPHPEFMGEAYSEENGRETFMQRSEEIGISREVANRILMTAQENARKFGMAVTALK